MIVQERMRWVWNVECMRELRNGEACTISVGNPNIRGDLGGLDVDGDNINITIRQVGCGL
jgi:hypothetical protein